MRMVFEFWPALTAGLIGGLAMSLVPVALKGIGIHLKMDLGLMWGTMSRVQGTAGRMLGLLVHFVVSGLIGLLYAAVFDLLGLTDNLWLWGLLAGVVHWLLASLFMLIVPPMHPEVAAERGAPGLFVRNFGSSDISAFAAGHLLYGLLVGIIYPLLHTSGSA